MTRRTLLLALFAARLRADAEQEVWDLFTSAASALAEDSAAGFLKAFDPAMPGYETLRANVTGLLRRAALASTIEFDSNEGSDSRREVELDWTLVIAAGDAGVSTERRQKHVKCRVEKRGKKWRVVAFEPVELFAP